MENRTRAWKMVLPAALAAVMVVTACSGGGDGGTPVTATPGGTSGTQGPEPTVAAGKYIAPHQKPGPAAERIFYKAFDVDRAPLDFQQGAMDMYVYSLKTAAARELRTNPNVRVAEAPASNISIVLNPAPSQPGRFNPFADKAMRQAVQYLINREFISSDIYQGMASPMVTQLASSDYDFLTVFDLAKESDFRYDPERARRTIQERMTALGGQMNNGHWEVGGQQVRLKFVIRVEDERREIGDLLRVELEKAGFTVAPTYQQFAPAIQTVYSSDPQAFEWHLYTEGWSRGAPEKYDFATINQMTAPWQGNMPGWREVGFWQYENAQLDDLGKRIYTGLFKDQGERDALYREMTQIAMEESVRLWVVTAQNSFPLNPLLQGVTSDLVAGPKTGRSIREMYVPGKEELTLGNLWVWTERTTWNPVGGFGDAYSSEIWKNLSDPPLVNHPFTGLPVPFRAAFAVETAGPNGKLPVPADAVMWDAINNKWTAAKATSSVSKVTYDFSKYFQSKWHDGQSITMADVMYSIAQSYELAYDPEKSRIEFALGVTARPYLDTFRGYHMVDNNRLDVYVDFWHFEESLIGSYATPSGLSMPWEVLAAMDSLVFDQRRAAYSDTAAARFNVPWISLVMRRDASLVERTLRGFLDKGETPEGVFVVNNRALVSPEEAKARYQAAIDWFDKYGLLVIGNGPFMLTRYDPPAQFAQLDAFRDATYPFKPGDFYLGAAPQLTIGRVEQPKVQVGKAADITVTVSGPGAVGVQYVLFDQATGMVVATGTAEQGAGATRVVRLDAATTGKLKTGLYQLFLAEYSDETAALTERRVDVEVMP